VNCFLGGICTVTALSGLSLMVPHGHWEEELFFIKLRSFHPPTCGGNSVNLHTEEVAVGGKWGIGDLRDWNPIC
jgi:hypothetical protein